MNEESDSIKETQSIGGLKGSARRYDLDWIRVIAVLLLVPYHTSMIFNLWNWHLKNNALSIPIHLFSSFVNPWHMPLFFFVAGASSWFALGF